MISCVNALKHVDLLSSKSSQRKIELFRKRSLLIQKLFLKSVKETLLRLFFSWRQITRKVRYLSRLFRINQLSITKIMSCVTAGRVEQKPLIFTFEKHWKEPKGKDWFSFIYMVTEGYKCGGKILITNLMNTWWKCWEMEHTLNIMYTGWIYMSWSLFSSKAV